MKRSLMKVGPSTLVVSLPSHWVKRFHLEKGDELIVEEQGDSLRLSTKKKLKEADCFVDISDTENPVLHKVITNLYKMGYKKIVIKYNPDIKIFHRYRRITQFELIKNRADHLTGMDIIDIKATKKGNFLEVEERAELDYSEFSKTLNKTFYHLINQSQQVLEAMKTKKRNIKNEVGMSERLINQTTDFCMRVLNTQGFEDYKKTGLIFYITNRLEELGDEYYHMYMYYHNNKFAVSKVQLELMKQTHELLRLLLNIYQKFNIKGLNTFSETIKNLISDYEKNFTSKMSVQQLRVISFVYSILKKLEDLTEILIALNHEQFRI